MTVEFIGAIALILGIYARLVAVVLIPILLGTIVTVRMERPDSSSPIRNGGWEFPCILDRGSISSGVNWRW